MSPTNTVVDILNGAENPLNTDMILDLIDWAERSEQKRLTDDEVVLYGKWDQGSWGYVTNTTDKPVTVNWSSMKDKDREKIRNGVCNTAFCMAGDAVIRSGYRMTFPTELGGINDEDLDDSAESTHAIKQRFTGRHTKSGKEIWEDDPHHTEHYDIETLGQKLLGLNGEEANVFFGGSNSLERLKSLANGFAVQRDLPVLFPYAETEMAASSW